MIQRKLNIVYFFVFFTLLFCLNIYSQTVDPLPKGVSIHQLDNGMQVLLIEKPALPMVGVNVVVKVGSAYESFATSGMSHMLEHLLFNGTTNRTQKQLYDDTDFIGGYNNANTSDYYTNYMMVTPAEHINKGMELQADMLFNSILPEEKFEKEKGIVLEEIAKSLGNSSEQMERNVISVLYQGHALSLPTLGTYTTIESMNRNDVWDFYKNYYVPNNMILSAIGNFETLEMLKEIEKIYGKAEPGIVQREISSNWLTGFRKLETGDKTSQKIYHRFYGGEDIILQMFFELPLYDTSDFNNMIDIVIDKKQDQIQSALKEKFPEQVKSVKLSSRLSPIKNYLQITVKLNNASELTGLLKYSKEVLSKLDFSLSQETIAGEIAKSRTSFLKNIEKPHMFGIYNAHIFAIQGIEAVLSSYSAKGSYEAADLLKKINIKSNPAVIIQYPNKEKEKTEKNNSATVELFENDNRHPQVIAVKNEASNLLAIHYLIKHKARLESEYGKDAAKILHDCFEQRLKSDINQKLSSKFGLTFVLNDIPYIPMDDIYLHPDFGYMRFEGLADYDEEIIYYLNKLMTDFTPTQEEFDKATSKFKSGGHMMMGMGKNMANEIFKKTYKSIIYKEQKYNDGPELNYSNLLSFANEYFQPSNMIISVVSPVDPSGINQKFLSFSGNKEKIEEAAYQDELELQPSDTTFEQTVGGEQSYLFWGFTKQIDPLDKPVLKALSLILADNIIFDIREKQGMAYRMSAGIDLVQDKALFYIRMGTRHQNVDVLLPQYPGFFSEKMISNLTDEELEKSINMYLGRMMFRRLSSINQAYYLAHSLYFNNDINYDKNFHSQLKNVKVKDVKNVAQKYMKVENPVTVIIR